MNIQYDLIVVGGGILGTFHASQKNLKVAILERNSVPQGATVRNFGQVVPSGMDIKWQNFGKESLNIYKDLQSKADLTVRQNGSVYIASNDEELQLIEELAQINKNQDYESVILSKNECIQKFDGLRSDYCKGGLFFPQEISVDSGEMIVKLHQYLKTQEGLDIFYNTTVVEMIENNSNCTVTTADGKKFTSSKIIICGGHEFKTLYPEVFNESDLEVSKLQMLQTKPQGIYSLPGNKNQNTPTYNRLNFPAGTYAKPSVQSSFNFGASQDFTIEFWVKPNANYSSDPVLIGNKNWNNGHNKGFVISGYSGQTFKMNIGDGSNRLDLTGGKLITNQWKHIAVTFDRDGLATMYDDGVPVTVGKMNNIGDITSNLPLTINQDGTNTYGVNLAVSYKDVRIWNAKLTNEAIVQWANQDVTSSHPFYSNLLANYKMTEASGNTLTDSGPLGNNATITSSPTRNLQTSETFTIQNYLNTPRQTDHFPTVLN